MNAKTTRIVTYVPIIGFILALTIGERADEETKFNINQSITLSVLMFACGLCGIIFGIIPILGLIMRIIFGLIGFGAFVLAIIAAVFAGIDQRFEIPVVSMFVFIK